MKDTKEKAREVFEYCWSVLAQGVFISEENQEKFIKEIDFILYSD